MEGIADLLFAVDLPSLRRGERIETWGRMDTGPSDKPIQGISPRFGGGSGLKLQFISIIPYHSPHLPSLRRGERIETDRAN